MFFITGKDISSQSNSYWMEGKVARKISYSFTKVFTEQLNVRINNSDQCRRTTNDIIGYAVSSNNNNNFKQSNCCSCIGVSEYNTNKGVCEIVIIGGTMNNE